jgi:hypothetical protein
MSDRNKVPDTSTAIASIKKFLGKPPLLRDEDALEYEDLLSVVATQLKLGDIVECILGKDVVDSTWEMRRAKRCEAAILNNSLPEALASQVALMRKLDDPNRVDPNPADRELAYAYHAGDAAAMKEVNELRAKHGLDQDSTTGLAYNRKLDTLEKIQRLIAINHARREQALRELERHREGLGSRLRSVVDADYKKVPQLPESAVGSASLQPADGSSSAQPGDPT